MKQSKKKKRKVCPFMSGSFAGYNSCAEKECAWWYRQMACQGKEDWSACAIKIIAEKIK